MRYVFVPSEMLRRLFDLCASVVLLQWVWAQTTPPNLPTPPANGTWVLLTDTAAANLQPTRTKRYLYVHQDRWYMSPPTTLRWNWTEGQGQELAGNYSYYNGVSTAAFTCPGGLRRRSTLWYLDVAAEAVLQRRCCRMSRSLPPIPRRQKEMCAKTSPMLLESVHGGRATLYVSEVSSEGATTSATPPGNGMENQNGRDTKVILSASWSWRSRGASFEIVEFDVHG